MSPRTYRPGDPEYFHATPPDSDAREVRSPEYDALLRQAVEENQAEKRKLAAMTPAQRDEYIREWAARIAPGLCAEATAHDREMSEPWISLPLPLAQRILAALEDPEAPDNFDLAAELRAVIGK